MARELVIISTARSGSTQLKQYLSQTPGIQCFGEIFAHKSEWKTVSGFFASENEARRLHEADLTKFWTTIVASYPGAAYVGAKLFYFHRAGDLIWDHFESRDVSVIHLIRDQIFDSYISLARAKTSGNWIERLAKPDAGEGGEITFHVREYLRRRDRSVQAYAKMRAIYETHPRYIEVKYEEISAPDDLAKKLSEFLQLECKFTETLRKQSRRAPIDYIVNRDDALPFMNDTLSGLLESRTAGWS